MWSRLDRKPPIQSVRMATKTNRFNVLLNVEVWWWRWSKWQIWRRGASEGGLGDYKFKAGGGSEGAKGGIFDSRVSALQGRMKFDKSMFVWTMLDGHIILRTSNDIFIFNLGLCFEGLFWERYIWGPNRVWRALKTSIWNTGWVRPEVLMVALIKTWDMLVVGS